MPRKIDTCESDPKKSFTEKKAEHIPSGYSWITCCLFDKLKKRTELLQRKKLYGNVL